MRDETFNAAGAAKALELIGKHVSVQTWKEKIDQESQRNLEIYVDFVSPKKEIPGKG